jgi:hypothetical protein
MDVDNAEEQLYLAYVGQKNPQKVEDVWRDIKSNPALLNEAIQITDSRALRAPYICHLMLVKCSVESELIGQLVDNVFSSSAIFRMKINSWPFLLLIVSKQQIAITPGYRRMILLKELFVKDDQSICRVRYPFDLRYYTLLRPELSLGVKYSIINSYGQNELKKMIWYTQENIKSTLRQHLNHYIRQEEACTIDFKDLYSRYPKKVKEIKAIDLETQFLNYLLRTTGYYPMQEMSLQ